MKCGVPQGLVLGPLLFILHNNKICERSKTFADDTNLLYDNLEHFLDTVADELKKSNRQFDWSKLTQNLSETKFVIFENRFTKLLQE